MKVWSNLEYRNKGTIIPQYSRRYIFTCGGNMFVDNKKGENL